MLTLPDKRSKPCSLQRLLLLLLLAQREPTRPGTVCAAVFPLSSPPYSLCAQDPRADPLGTLQQLREQLGSTTHGVHQLTLYTTAELQTPGQPFSNTPLFREGGTAEEGMDDDMLIKECSGRDGSQERLSCKSVHTPWPRKNTAVLIWKGRRHSFPRKVSMT